MKAKTVSVGFTKNLGNFQSMRVEIQVEATSELDTIDALTETAEAFVLDALDMSLTDRQMQIVTHVREQHPYTVSVEKR